jgi:ribosome-associated translation inhibitor RaiA
LRRLTDQELDEISDIAVEATENFIFSKVSKKEILDLHINVELSYEKELNVEILVDLDLDELSAADETEIAENAVDAALEKLDKFIAENYSD